EPDDLLRVFEAKEKKSFRTTVVIVMSVVFVGLALLAYTAYRIREAAIVANASQLTAMKAEEIAKKAEIAKHVGNGSKPLQDEIPEALVEAGTSMTPPLHVIRNIDQNGYFVVLGSPRDLAEAKRKA